MFCFFLLLSIFLEYSFFSSSRLSRMNFFLLLSFSLKLQFVNFDFLFIEDLTLFKLVSSFSRSTANFGLCFSSSWRTDCLVIVSAVSEISSEVDLTPVGPFNEFGRATRKLLFFLLINIWETLISLKLHWFSVALKF